MQLHLTTEEEQREKTFSTSTGKAQRPQVPNVLQVTAIKTSDLPQRTTCEGKERKRKPQFLNRRANILDFPLWMRLTWVICSDSGLDGQSPNSPSRPSLTQRYLAHQNHNGELSEKYRCRGPTSRNSNLTGLGWRPGHLKTIQWFWRTAEPRGSGTSSLSQSAGCW